MADDLHDDPLLSGVPEVDGYRVLDPAVLYARVGVGGMGSVYRGRHLNLEIDVAVKVLDPQLARQDPEFVTRFRREANLAAKINHPNLVRVYDVKEGHGLHYLVMEYVEGETALERVARKGPLGAVEALDIVLEAAKGLGAAHAEGVVHRDVKPENILIDGRGRVKVADLGLAKAVEGSGGVTRGRLQMGTPRYMPPEQWEDARKVGPPGDVWALGATFYFLLAADHAIAEGSLTEMFRKVCTEPFPDIRERRREVPDALVRILERCTARGPGHRYADATQLAEVLHQFRRRLETPPQLPDEEAGHGTTRLAAVSPPPLRTIAKIGSAVREGTLRTPPPLTRIATPPVGPRPKGPRIALVAVILIAVGAGAYWLVTSRDGREGAPGAGADYDPALSLQAEVRTRRERLGELPRDIADRIARTADEAERAILRRVESAARDALKGAAVLQVDAAVRAGDAMLQDRQYGKARAKFESAKRGLDEVFREIETREEEYRAEAAISAAEALREEVAAWYATNRLRDAIELSKGDAPLRSAREKLESRAFREALAAARDAARSFAAAREAGPGLLARRGALDQAGAAARQALAEWEAFARQADPPAGPAQRVFEDADAGRAKLAEAEEAASRDDLAAASAAFEEAKRLFDGAVARGNALAEAQRPAAAARERATRARAVWLDFSRTRKPRPPKAILDAAAAAMARAEEQFERAEFEAATRGFVAAAETYESLHGRAAASPSSWNVLDARRGAGGWARKVQDPRTGVVFILVDPGTFEMGSPDGEAGGEADERPRHEVRITRAFYLAETETTVGQWRQFAAAAAYETEAERSGGSNTLKADGTWELNANATWRNPLPAFGFASDDRHPVTHVCWNDVKAFCDHWGYRLPKEAEWDYACRAGTKGRYWWGDADEAGKGKGNFQDQAAKRQFAAWTSAFPFDDGHVFMAPVGSFEANPWGFKDMLGNVCERCADAYDGTSYQRRVRDDPFLAEGNLRVVRGGAWYHFPGYSRAAKRFAEDQSYRNAVCGFRVARTPE